MMPCAKGIRRQGQHAQGGSRITQGSPSTGGDLEHSRMPPGTHMGLLRIRACAMSCSASAVVAVLRPEGAPHANEFPWLPRGSSGSAQLGAGCSIPTSLRHQLIFAIDATYCLNFEFPCNMIGWFGLNFDRQIES
jgi:hypothetical protein